MTSKELFAFHSFVFAGPRSHPIDMRPPPMNTAKLTLVRQPFDHPDFLFELKHDGFRALAHTGDDKCELVWRKRNSNKSFEALRANLAQLKVKNAVIDGEIVCLDSEGRSIFNVLLHRQGYPAFCAFDCCTEWSGLATATTRGT
jgi:ATP-dependent DNA ligase